MRISRTPNLEWRRPAPNRQMTDLLESYGFEQRLEEGDRFAWLPTPIGNNGMRPGMYSPPTTHSRRWLWTVGGRSDTRYVPYALPSSRWGEALDRFALIDHYDFTLQSRPDVTEFVNEFGILGLPVTSTPLTPMKDTTAEPVYVWDYCAHELRTFQRLALELNSRTAKLEYRDFDGTNSLVIDIGDGNRAAWLNGDLREWRRANGYVMPLPQDEPLEDLADPGGARKAVFDALGLILAAWLNPLITLRMDYEWLDNQPKGRMDIGIGPGNLLGAMWLEAASRLDTQMNERLCTGCGGYFNAETRSEQLREAARSRAEKRGVTLGPARTDRGPRDDLQYCSDRCSKRVSRARKGPRQVKKAAKTADSEND